MKSIPRRAYKTNITPRHESKSNRFSLKGDTLIEVMFAVAIFGFIAISAIALMNRGLSSIQNNLETTMARQEIDAQAEALRFIHAAYLSEPKIVQSDSESADVTEANNFRNLWKAIIDKAYYPQSVSSTESVDGTSSIKHVEDEDENFYTRTVDNRSSCDEIFRLNNQNHFSIPKQSFVINPRGLNKLIESDPLTHQTRVLSDTEIKRDVLLVAGDTSPNFQLASTYPRLLYNTTTNDNDNLSDVNLDNNSYHLNRANAKLDQSEGVWVTSVASSSGLKCWDDEGNPTGFRPDFYDFHIQTCWDSLSGNASTISSTVRLFNPDQVSLKKQGVITFDDAWQDFDRVLETCGTDHPSGYCEADPNNPGGWRHASGYTVDYTMEHSVFVTNPDYTGTIRFNGYNVSNMDEGKRLELTGETEVDIALNARNTGYTGHTNGTFHITLGPIHAQINARGGSFQVIGDDSTLKTIDAQQYGLKISYNHGTYTVYANRGKDYTQLDNTDTILSYNSGDNSGNITIELFYTHGPHGCDLRDSAVIENILISRPQGDSSAGGCVKVAQPTPMPEPPDPITPEPTPGPQTCADAHPGMPVMQNWNGAASLNVHDSVTLCDERDRKAYKVAKLKDNLVWMTEELKLDLDTADITASNTNNPTSTFLSTRNVPSSGDWCAEYNSTGKQGFDCLNDRVRWYTSNDGYGNLYDFYTATAGHGTKEVGNVSTSGDICPSGWRLPEITDLHNFDNTYMHEVASNYSLYESDPINMTKFSGRIHSQAMINGRPTELLDRGARLQLWSGTSHIAYRNKSGYDWLPDTDSNKAHSYTYVNGGVGGASGNANIGWGPYPIWKTMGLAIRCVQNHPRAKIGFFNIVYDKNDGSGEQTVVIAQVGSAVAINGNTFNRPGYTFTGWNTKSDGSGTAYSIGQIVTDLAQEDGTIILYAQWERQSEEVSILLDVDEYGKYFATERLSHSSTVTLAVAKDAEVEYSFHLYNIDTFQDGSIKFTRWSNYWDHTKVLTGIQIDISAVAGGKNGEFVFYLDAINTALSVPQPIYNNLSSYQSYLNFHILQPCTKEELAQDGRETNRYVALSFCLSKKHWHGQFQYTVKGSDALVESSNPTYWIIGRGKFTEDNKIRFTPINKITNSDPTSFL